MAVQVIRGLWDKNEIWSKRTQVRSGPVFRPAWQQKMLLCGWPGSGKTSAILSIPRCLTIDSEAGSDEIIPAHTSSARETISSYEDAEQLLQMLEQDNAKNGPNRAFDTVAIDTADGLGGSQNSIMCEYVVRDAKTDFVSAFGANGAGWSRLHELFYKFRLRLHAAGYGTVETCHLRKKQYTDNMGNQRVGVTRDLTARVDSIVRNGVNFVGVVAKSIKVVPKIGKVKIGDKMVDKEVGTEQKVIHEVTFRSKDNEQEEFLKARLPIPATFEFSPEDFWEKWSTYYDQAVECVKKQWAEKNSATIKE